MISIIIPTYNNINYLKLCLKSLNKNSKFDHEIIFHVNDGSDGTISYIKQSGYKYTYSESNIGLCSAINKASKLATKKYLLYSHDDMYFCPEWDNVLINEIKLLKNSEFYLSGTMIEPKSGHIIYNFGDTIENFRENDLLSKYKNINFYDHQGTHFAPHLVSLEMWNKVGGFSEEFNPGDGSDSDLNMKLWKAGVRLFKGLNDFKVYHFGSISMRKKDDIIKNDGTKTFLKKWGITPKFFFKYYLRTGKKFDGLLNEPNKNLFFYFELLVCKIKKSLS